MMKKVLFSLAITGLLLGSSYLGLHQAPSHETSASQINTYAAAGEDGSIGD